MLGLGLSFLQGALLKTPYSTIIANEFKARVEADGGTVESMSCLKADIKTLNPIDRRLYAYLLDTYSGAAAAYSLRQLSSTYSGDAIVVTTNGSDSASIGFVNNELDTASLEAFAGGGDAYVSVWYDQSGNGNDVTQTSFSAMPKIVSAGSTILENSKPVIDFNGVSQFLNASGTDDFGLLGTLSIFAINKNLGGASSVVMSTGLTGSSSASFMQWSLTGYTSNQYQATTSDGTTRINEYITTADYGTQCLVSMINDESGLLQISVNDTTSTGQSAVAPMNDANYEFAIGLDSFRNAYFLNGNIQEIVIYKSLPNKNGIETNINSHYNIYP